MYSKSTAYALLEDWATYKNIHYSEKTQFDKAVDIEIEKEAVSQLASLVQQALMDDACLPQELDYRTRMMEHHLRTFKDQITFELLRNGNTRHTAQV